MVRVCEGFVITHSDEEDAGVSRAEVGVQANLRELGGLALFVS